MRLTVTTVEKLAGQYQEVPKVLRDLPPPVLETGLRLAHGNVHRLATSDGKTVVVHNRPIW